MNTTHTPGPWRAVMGISQMVDHGTTIYHRGIWGVYTDAKEHGEEEADARLIAAAPDLLAALRAIAFAFEVSIHDHEDSGAYQSARAAIEKATRSTQ